MLSPVRRRTTKEAVIKALEDYIVTNELSSGDPLPPEQTLVQRLGVSRNILREALQSFRTLGIIESKPKRGMIIRELLPSDPFKGYLPYLKGRRNNIAEIAEARKIIEIGLIPVLVSQANPALTRQLQQLAERFEKVPPLKRPSLEVEFHALLLSVSRNPIITSLKSLVVDFFEKQAPLDAACQRQKSGKTITQEHSAIAKAIGKGSEKDLKTAIDTHYQGYEK